MVNATIAEDESKYIFVSPFTLEIDRSGLPGKRGYDLPPRNGKRNGLWFRELTTVDMHFADNNREFLRCAKEQFDNAQPIKPPPPQDRNKLTVKENQDQAKYASDEALVESGTSIWSKTLDFAASQLTARRTVLVVTVPNPARVFAFNISRSAFVQDKKIDLTISSGMLTKVEIKKPSEVEGFSEIPLDLTEKLAGPIKDILTVRSQSVPAGSPPQTHNPCARHPQSPD